MGRINAGACIQLVFSLEIVAIYSPSENQRASARDLLNCFGWEEDNIMYEI